VPSKTIKLSSSTSGHIFAASLSAKISGSFLKGLVSWKILTLFISFKGKNL
jgi:hypothetical protein